MLLKLDFRLIDSLVELDMLGEHLQLIEENVERGDATARKVAETRIREESLNPDDPEWHIVWQAYSDRTDCLPRIFRGPFLVILYAVFEATVTEVAGLIQSKQSQEISITDLRGGFLSRAQKYYKHILEFELYSDNSVIRCVSMLSELRNALVHANGRVELVNRKSRDRIRGWEREHPGISTDDGYVIFDAGIVDEMYQAVRGSLEDLIARYRRWDDSMSKAQGN